MNIFHQIPPTAGFPIFPRDLLSLGKEGTLEEDFKHYLKVPFARVSYSGTAAFYLILESLKLLSNKSTVIIPSFVCPLLPLAIKKAGLKAEVCDIQHNSFDFEYDALAKLCENNADILAVVAVHLAGIPLDPSFLNEVAKKHGIFIIEDCAQSLGAEYRGVKAGASGDFSFFSLCRGKGLTIYEGGVIASKTEKYSKTVDESIARLVKDDLFSEGLKLLELFGYWFFYRPSLFWFVFNLPQDFWNARGDKVRAMAEYYTSDFAIHTVSRIRKTLGHASFYHLEEEISKQHRKARRYLKGLEAISGIKVLQEAAGTKATYPYLALVFDDVAKRERVLNTLRSRGLGASLVYLCAIADYDYLKGIIPKRPSPNAQYLAAHSLTLSTSVFLTERDLDTIVKLIVDKCAYEV